MDDPALCHQHGWLRRHDQRAISCGRAACGWWMVQYPRHLDFTFLVAAGEAVAWVPTVHGPSITKTLGRAGLRDDEVYRCDP